MVRPGPLHILHLWPDLFPSPQPRRSEQLPIPLSASGIYLTDPNHLVSYRLDLLFILAWLKKTLFPLPLISSPGGGVLGEQQHMEVLGSVSLVRLSLVPPLSLDVQEMPSPVLSCSFGWRDFSKRSSSSCHSEAPLIQSDLSARECYGTNYPKCNHTAQPGNRP